MNQWLPGEVGMAGAMVYKGAQGNFWGWLNVCSLECGDGFMGAHICQNRLNCTLSIFAA